MKFRLATTLIKHVFEQFTLPGQMNIEIKKTIGFCHSFWLLFFFRPFVVVVVPLSLAARHTTHTNGKKENGTLLILYDAC